jgi:hypothetical protein
MAGLKGWYSAIGWNQPSIVSAGMKVLEEARFFGRRPGPSPYLLAENRLSGRGEPPVAP